MPKNAVGQKGEQIARAFLLKHKYEILAANYSTRQGELDIVARKGGELVFVEVKARTNEKFGAAAEAVTRTKRRRVMSAALSYIKEERPPFTSYRFDVIEVYFMPGGEGINHIVAAFTYD
ncbi:MAG: YraN family protein [Acidaminococcales bacterium]|jgi:putative endonuclease|nr:YraN family protein [Acidaminococcales bacterium]